MGFTVKLISNDGEIVYYILDKEEWSTFTAIQDESVMISWLLDNGTTYDPEIICQYILREDNI